MMHFKYNSYFVVIYSLFFVTIQLFSEGFVTGTLVKTPIGYEKIENLKTGDTVLCFDKNRTVVERRIIYTAQKLIDSYKKVYIEDELVGCSSDQLFYNVDCGKWISTLSLNNHMILSRKDTLLVESIETLFEKQTMYLIGIEEYHNFFITTSDICVHNFVPAVVIGISFAFGSGSLELAGISAGLAGLGTYLGYQWHKKKQRGSFEISETMPGGMMPEDSEEKKKKRDKAIKEFRAPTNKEARQAAEEMGFKEDKCPPFDSHVN